jgi:hypothetical protein
MLSELHSLNLKLCSKQYNKKIYFAPDCGATSKQWLATLHNQNEADRPCQWAVYVFSYVYGPRPVDKEYIHCFAPDCGATSKQWLAI